MNLFSRLFKNLSGDSQTLPMASPTIVEDAATSSDVVKTEEGDQNKTDQDSNVYTIAYGTRMAIDGIYLFLDKDFEEKGYNDAMCSTDGSYKESGERIIRDELKTLFRRVKLRYKEDQRNLATTIKQVKEQGMLDHASALECKMETLNEHLQELMTMENNLDNNESSMMRPIESYRRGFLKGLTAKTNELLTV